MWRRKKSASEREMKGPGQGQTRPAEDDEDVARFVGGIPDTGSVHFRCAGCGIWKTPETADLHAFFREGGYRWVCGDVECIAWKLRATAYEKQQNESLRQTQTADTSLLEAEAQKVQMARGKPESPLIRALRLRVADTTKPAMQRGVLSVLDTYSRPGKGFLKEESVRAIQSDYQEVCAYGCVRARNPTFACSACAPALLRCVCMCVYVYVCV